MGNLEFNLTGLKSVYNEAYKKKEPVLVFDIEYGDMLFLFLRRTNTLIKFKMYGSHKNGDFKIYVNNKQKEDLIKEIGLKNNNGTVAFFDFLCSLNKAIPNDLKFIDAKKNNKEIWVETEKGQSDNSDKTNKIILRGIMRLPNKHKPKDKTLQKLNSYINSDKDTVAELIRRLKEKKLTLAWTDNEKYKAKSLADIIIKISEK